MRGVLGEWDEERRDGVSKDGWRSGVINERREGGVDER